MLPLRRLSDALGHLVDVSRGAVHRDLEGRNCTVCILRLGGKLLELLRPLPQGPVAFTVASFQPVQIGDIVFDACDAIGEVRADIPDFFP